MCCLTTKSGLDPSEAPQCESTHERSTASHENSVPSGHTASGESTYNHSKQDPTLCSCSPRCTKAKLQLHETFEFALSISLMPKPQPVTNIMHKLATPGSFTAITSNSVKDITLGGRSKMKGLKIFTPCALQRNCKEAKPTEACPPPFQPRAPLVD